MSVRMSRLAATVALAWSGVAQAQTAAFDPAQLPAYHGKVQVFTLTPRGDIDGFVLSDGAEIKTPPHLSTQIALLLRPGDDVTIHGLKAAKAPLIQALSVTNDRDGKSVVDRGPEPPLPGADKQTVAGRVRMALHGPRGEINGVLLDDGAVLKLPPTEADRFAPLLAPGHEIAAEGAVRATVAGKVVDVTALGPSPGKLEPID